MILLCVFCILCLYIVVYPVSKLKRFSVNKRMNRYSNSLEQTFFGNVSRPISEEVERSALCGACNSIPHEGGHGVFCLAQPNYLILG